MESEMAADAAGAPVVEVEQLSHGFGGAPLLDIAHWRVEAGEHCLVVGPSGSGKSTLLHLLAGLALPRAGTIRIAGRELGALAPAERDRFRGRAIGVLLQSFHLLDSLSVLDNVRLARALANLPDDRLRCLEVLEELGLGELVSARPSMLSHGQAQRVALARAVVNQPALILADEPTSSLDDDNCERVTSLIEHSAARHGATLIMATHDARLRERFPRRLSLAPTAEGDAAP